MSLLMIVVAALIALGGILFIVYLLRPEVFKVDFGVTRLVNLKIEMRSPRPPEQPPTSDGATG